MQTLMKLEGLTKVYGEGDLSVEALRGVNLEVGVGDYLAVMGPSGSGKSTLMHILGLLDSPTAGSYLLDGEEVAGFSRRRLAHLRNKKIGCCATSSCRCSTAAWGRPSVGSWPARLSRWSGLLTAPATVRTSSPEGSASAAPSPGPLSANRR